MTKKIYIAGHNGMVGSALVRLLGQQSDVEFILRDRAELDLIDQAAVFDFFDQNKIDEIYIAAARVGGIHANNEYRAEFIYENLMIECNVIHGAYRANVKKLMFLGSSCIYPKLATQPMHESELLKGELESTNQPYAIAKIAGIELCQSYCRQYGVDYRCVMPTNLYGQNDNYHAENSHVIPALIQRIHNAKIAKQDNVVIWGSGSPKREFLHVDDMASACVHVMSLSHAAYQSLTDAGSFHVNVGTGQDGTIKELAETLKEIIGFSGELTFDTSKLDGVPRKLLDIERLSSTGWQPSITLPDGLKQAYQWFLQNEKQLRGGH